MKLELVDPVLQGPRRLFVHFVLGEVRVDLLFLPGCHIFLDVEIRAKIRILAFVPFGIVICFLVKVAT